MDITQPVKLNVPSQYNGAFSNLGINNSGQVYQKPTTSTSRADALGTTAPAQTAPKLPTQSQNMTINGLTLNAGQQSLMNSLKKNNPDLYGQLTGSSPVVTSTGDLGTTNLDAPAQQQQTNSALTDAFDKTAAELEQRQAEQVEGTPTQPSDMRDLALQQWAEASGMLVNRAAGEYDIKKQQGVYSLEEQAAQSQMEYEQAVVAQRRKIQEMRQNSEGKSRDALEADIANYKYDSDQNLADLAMTAYYQQGSYDRAVRMAQDAIDAQYKPIEALMNHYKDMYTLLGDDLTESEKMQFQSQLNIAEYNIESVKAAKNAALQAAAFNQAPDDVLKAIKNASSMEDVWVAAGNYGIDPNLSLAQDKFAWDKYIASENLKLAWAKAAGDITAEEEAATKAGMGALAQANKSLQAVNEALNNRIGLGAATGKLQGGLGAATATAALGATAGGLAAGPFGALVGGIGGSLYGGLSAEKAAEDFKNDVKAINAGMTLSNFANLGFSLAPVTEKEVQLVGDMAGDLTSSIVIQEDGSLKITGSQSEFENNLEAYRDQLETTIKALLDDQNLQNNVTATDLAEMKAAYNALTTQ